MRWLLLLPVVFCAAAPTASVRIAPVVAAPVVTASVAKTDPPKTHDDTITIRNASRSYGFVIHKSEAGVHVDVDDKSGTKLQTISLDEIAIRRDDSGAVLVDSADLYEDQGTIDVGDFDFDGREDFAIQVNQDGPYGGPTFAVYLQNANGLFEESDELSELTRTTLGLFQVDPQRRLLVTMAKSGCCYHETEEHEVHGGKPVVVHRLIEDAMSDDQWVVTTEEALVRGKWTKHVTHVPQ